jgi:exopolysaccharide production protein ExoQ
MKIWLSKNLLAKLEFGTAAILLLFSEGLVFSDFVRAITSYASYGFLFIVIAIRWKRFAYAFTKDPLLALFILLAAFSFFWSANPSATLSELKLSVRSTLFGIYLAMQYRPREQIRLLCWTYGISIILCLVMVIVFPSVGTKVFEGKVSMIGIYTHKQTLGSHMSLAASVFLISVFDRRFNRWIALAGLVAAFILILGSLSKTGLISFLLLLSLMPLYKVAKQAKYRDFLFFMAFSILSVTAALVLLNLETIVVGYLGKNLEFNGRLPVWKLAIDQGLHQPWLGYGFNGFWTSDFCTRILRSTWANFDPGFKSGKVIFHAHDSFVDIFLQLGSIGLFVFVANLFTCLKRVISLTLATRATEYFWMILFLGYFLVFNFIEGAIIFGQNITWIVYMAIVVSSALELSRMKKELCSNISLSEAKMVV